METIISDRLSEQIKKDKSIIAVLLFGSYARGEPNRDIDLAIILNKKLSDYDMSKIRLKYSSMASGKLDIQIFQQLPLYIRIRVLKEGKILISNNIKKLYEVAFQTIKEFGMFEKLYNMYLQKVENG